jgi:hypothetical protein
MVTPKDQVTRGVVRQHLLQGAILARTTAKPRSFGAEA